MRIRLCVQNALFVVSLFLSGSVIAAPPLTTPLLLERGVIADANRGIAYIAAPSRTLDAIDLATGRTLWSSTNAALPIGGNGTYVVGQVEETTAATTLKLVVLDASTGHKVSAASVTLPPGVNALVADGYKRQFRVTAEPNGALLLVSWFYQNFEAEDSADDPVAQLAGSFLLSPLDGRVVSISGGHVARLPDNLASYDAYSAQPWVAGNVSARVDHGDHAPFVLKRTETGSGRPLPDVVLSQHGLIAVPSADQRHLAVVESVAASGTEWVKYRLRVFSTDTADQVTEFVRDVSATPFVVFGDNLVIISPPIIKFTGAVASGNPLSISALGLTTGVQRWNVELRELAFHGPIPPARSYSKPKAESRGPFHAAAESLPVTPGTWAPIGPTSILNGQTEGISGNPVVGAVNSIVTHPTDANTIWIGTVNGGIWKTTNAFSGSPSWVPLTDSSSFSSLSLAYLSADASVPSGLTLVAAAGATSSFHTTLVPGQSANGPFGGVIRTTNGNDFISLASSGLAGKNISGLVARGSVIIASTWGDPPAFNSGGGLYRSSDTGATFSQLTGPTSVPGTVFDVKGQPSPNSNVLFAVSGGGIYMSSDTEPNIGTNWTRVSASSPQLEADLGNQYVNNAKLAVLPHVASGATYRVAVGIINDGGDPLHGHLSSLYIGTSSDSMAWTWTQLGNPSNLHPQDQGRLNFSIALDPTSPKLVYVGGDHQPIGGTICQPVPPDDVGAVDGSGRLFRVDGSQTPLSAQPFTLTHCIASFGCSGGTSTNNNSAPHADSRFLVVDASATPHLLEADDGGIYYRSNPGGIGDWYSLNGNLQVTEAHSVAWDHLAHVAITGNQDTGVSEQLSTGGQWATVTQYQMCGGVVTPRPGAGDGGDVGVNNTSSTTLSGRWSSHPNFVDRTHRILDQNSNLVDKFSPDFRGTSVAPTWGQAYTPVEINRIDATHMLVAGTNDLFESVDQGETCSPTGLGVLWATAMVYGSQDSPYSFYAITTPSGALGEGRVFVRTSGSGDATEVTGPWAATGSGIAHYRFTDITSDPTNSNTAYVVGYFTKIDGTIVDRVYGTTNAGQVWTDVTGNLNSDPNNPDCPDIRTIVFIPGSPSRIAIGGLYGVFVMTTTDPSHTWQRFASGLPNTIVYDLHYDAVEDILVAATMGQGVWKLTSVGGSPGNPPAAPTGLTATVMSATSVQVTWQNSAGATDYHVYRGSSINGNYTEICSSSCSSGFVDSGAASGTVYLYKVRASNGVESTDSNLDLATTEVPPSNPVVVIDHNDILFLRGAVRDVRALAGLSDYAYTDAGSTVPSTGSPIKGVDVQELRIAVQQAWTQLHGLLPTLTVPSWSDTNANVDPATNGGLHYPVLKTDITNLWGWVKCNGAPVH